MSRRAAPRRRRAAARAITRAHGGELHRLLSLPARRNMRWPVIVGLVLASGSLYAQVLLTAAPMPPSKAPVSATDTSARTTGHPERITARTASDTTSSTSSTSNGTTSGPADRP
ncbi:hypothetical protein ACFZB9_08370 [Kitasatospora sp. NPDC008050]|uniref:hypothetical protein n=1 Tax=Kitasatospora sp. NPDC008050 TaxID=3364021 RepID=UPI0036E9EEA1